MSNTNRDLLMQVDVKNSAIKGGGFNFYITDKNTSNFFVQLVIDMSTNPVIHKYVAIENASDYKLILKCIKPNGQLLSIEGTLMNEEESLFQYNLTEEQKDVVGTYQCEYWIYSTVNEQEEIITTAPFNFTVKESIINKLDGAIEDSEDYPILLDLIDEVKELQGNNLAEDYGDRVLLELSVEDIREAFRLARTRAENGVNTWYVNLRIPPLNVVEGERYQIDFLGKTVSAICNNSWEISIYGNDIYTEVGTYVDPDVLDDESWVDDETTWSLTIDYEIYGHLTDDELTSLVIKQTNVKPIAEKYFDQDFRLGYSLSMGRHLGYEVGEFSTALGLDSVASGESSFAQGEYSFATGYCSSAMGCRAFAEGAYSHAEGSSVRAEGYASYAMGINTRAVGEAQQVFGRYNIYEGDDIHNYVQIVGNGHYGKLSNAYTLDWKGNGWFAGNVTVGADKKELATKEYVDSVLGDLEELLGGI